MKNVAMHSIHAHQLRVEHTCIMQRRLETKLELLVEPNEMSKNMLFHLNFALTHKCLSCQLAAKLIISNHCLAVQMSTLIDSATSFAIGDPVVVSDAIGTYNGIVIDFLKNGNLSVQMIKKHADQLYRVSSDAYDVPLYAIEKHIHLNDDGDAPKAFDTLGFRMIDGSTFVKLSDEENGLEAPIGKAEFDIYSSDGDDSVGSLQDFIVEDDDCEPFCQAEDNSEFVRETHNAVRAFNHWKPKSDVEAQTKAFIKRQEQKAIFIDDNARFKRNLPGASNYSYPG